MIRLQWDTMKASELSPNNASRHHHMQLAKKRKQLKRDTEFMLRDADLPAWTPMNRIRIKYIAYHCDKPLDPDNLIAGMKYAVDGMVAAGVVPDDNPYHIAGYDVEYEKVPHRTDIKLVMEIKEA